MVLSLPAAAQPAANARPSGGVVAAGSATISESAAATTIEQSSQRAALNWQSFNLGSQQTVDFVQPSASAIALNRVISPNPSQIAGRIDANGQVVLVNQSGVTFYKGTQVNANSLVVSAAGISNQNFMAGRMVFDQAAKPNAAVVNQGTITMGQAGLAALVAPQVANSGVITAKLGHVVLAGAKTATLDLYGDGLLSLDVSNEVTQAPVGPGGTKATVLVTNTGAISAAGGTVQLTARAADGIVQTLVQSGGTVERGQRGRPHRHGDGERRRRLDRGGRPADGNGRGGRRDRRRHRNRRQPQRRGGRRSARINASGRAGGGVVAIGTDLARARGGPGVAPTVVAANTTIAHGATIGADATANGNGGRVTVLSKGHTKMAGSIGARGGPQGGNGGLVEESGASLSATGPVDVSAPNGLPRRGAARSVRQMTVAGNRASRASRRGWP